MKKYSLQLIDAGKEPRWILESEDSLDRVRSVASNIKKRYGRKLIIFCDGKELKKVDDIAYQGWLERNEQI